MSCKYSQKIDCEWSNEVEGIVNENAFKWEIQRHLWKIMGKIKFGSRHRINEQTIVLIQHRNFIMEDLNKGIGKLVKN